MKTFNAFAATAILLVGLAWIWSGLDGEAAPTPPTRTVPPTLPISEVLEPTPEPGVEPAPYVVNEVGETLQLRAGLSHGAIGEASFGELYAEIRLQAGETLPENRPPLNVALVIDRSGSMSGDPMEHARQAARTFVNALEPGDRISIVSFDHRSRIDVPSTVVDDDGRRRLLQAIDGIRVGGATNISDGLRDGFEQVRNHREAHTVDRVVLMTDGIPNVGITDIEGLSTKTRTIRNEGITVTALGFGVMYNAEMMAAMAQEGAGNYRYIGDSADLELAFSDELEDLRSTVASGIQLELLPEEGVRIADIYGFNHEEIRGGKRITLGDLRAEGRRSVVVRLEVDAGVTGSIQEILGIRAQYVDRVLEAPANQEMALSAQRVDTQAQVDESINTNVMARVEEIRSQNSLREVIDLYASGRRDEADRRLQAERVRSRQARTNLRLEETEEVQRVDRAFDLVDQGMQRHAPSSAAGRGMMMEASEVSMDAFQGR